MLRFCRALVLSVVMLSVVPAAAGAVPGQRSDRAYLGGLWTKVLETPSAQNPFGTGGTASGCFRLGHAVAPFGPAGVASCTVKLGTKMFVAASSFECSTIRGDHGTVNHPFGTTFPQLLACARYFDAPVAPTVAVDGTAVPLREVETGPLYVVLPANNIFGLPAGSTGVSGAHGWVVLVHPLTPGTHIVIIQTGTSTIRTTIIVKGLRY